MDLGGIIGGPGKDKQTDWGQETGVDGRDQTAFGCGQTVFHDLRFEDVVEVGEITDDGDRHPDTDTQEHQTHLTQVETVAVSDGVGMGIARGVDDGENFKKAVEYLNSRGKNDCQSLPYNSGRA